MPTEHTRTPPDTAMTGAEAVIRTAAAAGIDVCFGRAPWEGGRPARLFRHSGNR